LEKSGRSLGFNMPKVFIIVLNWNRQKDTLDCLKSIRKLTVGDYILETIVVDNGSTEKLALKNVKVISNRENLGFAGGNNVGIKYALENGADYVLVLNNDTLVDRNLVMELLKVARKYKDFGAASPKIYFAGGFEYHKDRYKKSQLSKVIWYAGGKIDWDNVYGKTRGVDEVDTGDYDSIEETDFATGTCLFMTKYSLKKTGLFDEKYFMYYEDTDLSVRMKEKGLKVLYVPNALVWHKVAQSSGVGSELNDYFISRNRLLFGIRHAPVRSKLALVRESVGLLLSGRKWQKKGVGDFYLGRFGKGSWPLK